MINSDVKLPVIAGNFSVKTLYLVIIMFGFIFLGGGCCHNTIEYIENNSIPHELPHVNFLKEYEEEKMDWWKDGRHKDLFLYDMPLSSKRQITIAVVDTGISENLLHNDKIFINTKEIDGNNKDDDCNGFIDDINGWNFVDDNNDVINYNENSVHASAIIGLLIGEEQQELYHGLLKDYDVKIVPIKSLDDNTLSGNVDDVIKSIEYAELINADIVILSFSTYVNSKKFFDVVKQSKMLFVVAAGNEGRELGENYKVYPACYGLENIISVAALGQDGSIDTLSNYSELYVDVAAPGIDIMCYLDKGKYVLENGTSFSVPFVAYAATVLKSISNEELTSKETKDIICKSVNKIKGNYIRYGTINITEAIEYLQSNGLSK